MKTQVCCTLFLILVSQMVQADWLCTEASSVRVGSTITACGVGKSKNLEEARNLSREDAIHEFNQLCKISADCNQFDYNVVPKRTDCQIHDDGIVCFRAIDFEITEHLKKDASINKEDLQKDLNDTRAKIDDLQEKMYKTRQLQQAQYELEVRDRQLKQLEARNTKLQSMSQDEESPNSYSFYSNRNDSTLKFGLSYWDGKLTAASELDLALTISYEVKATNWLGVQIDFSHGGDITPDEAPKNGVPGTSGTFKGNQSYDSLSAALLIYTGVSKTYVKLEGGAVQATREWKTVTYSPIGTGTSETSSVTTLKSFSGVSIGFDSRDNNKGWGTYAELGARATGSNVGVTSTIGLAYGF